MAKGKHFLKVLNKRFLIIFVCVLIVFTDAYAQRNETTISKRMFGANLANINDYPFMVAIFEKYYWNISPPHYIGSCTLITSRTLLGAAHVTHKIPVGALFGRIGSANMYTGKIIQFSKIIEHPEFDEEKMRNDIALIILENDIADLCLTQPEPVPIAIPLQDKTLYSKTAIAVGWGDVELKYSDYEYCLRAAELDIIDASTMIVNGVPNDDSRIIAAKEGVALIEHFELRVIQEVL
ncbi:trypsin-4-like isoform X2 [Centruroides sculpturatus]|uniref:trypsin-4-like isoform X2 n=1 Tax=Centruroides sculpturatus TaxID=218467 RepID=UPI000C6E45EB|nr:trypsin-4-like isoform X2 [Centruroides sculpturatus]